MNNNPSKCLLFLRFFSHSVVFKSLWPKDCSTSGFLVLHYLPELFRLMSTESVMPYNHLILCRPLLLCLSVIKKWAWERDSKGTCVYLWLIHVDVWQRPTQYCKAIILQLKINLKIKTVNKSNHTHTHTHIPGTAGQGKHKGAFFLVGFLVPEHFFPP